MAAESGTAQNNLISQTFYDRIIHKLFNKDTSDFTFCFGPSKNDQKKLRMAVYAHKTLLSTISPVFAAMFSGNWKESTSVDITDASFDAFNVFIEYFYSEQVSISADNVGEILYLAHKYDIQELVLACSSFLLEHVTVDDVVSCISLSCTYGLDNLKLKCKRIIIEEADKVFESEEFLECSEKVLSEILLIESNLEVKFFDACLNWAQNKCRIDKIDAENGENLRKVLGDCFDLIKFKEMNVMEFNKRLSLHKDIFSKDEIIDIYTHNGSNHDTRYQSNIVFEFKERWDSGISSGGISRVLFNVSQNMKLRSCGVPSDINEKSVTIFKYDSASKLVGSVKYAIRLATIRGIDCYEFVAPPIFEPQFSYDIFFDYFPKFIASVQNVNGVTLNITNNSSKNTDDMRYTVLSTIHFEKCD